MNRKKTILLAACIAIWTGLCVFNLMQQNKISKLQAQNDDTKKICGTLEGELLACEENNRNMQEKLEEHEQSQEEAMAELELYVNAEQAFHGRWFVYAADQFYFEYLGIEDADIEVQGIEDKLPLFLDYHTQLISINGPERIPITREPRYRFRVRPREELFEAIEHTGIDTKEIEGLLDKSYCVEMSFDDLKEWDRMIYPEEERFINAKYYPLNFDVMLCVPQDGSGELIFMRRFIDWMLEK